MSVYLTLSNPDGRISKPKIAYENFGCTSPLFSLVASKKRMVFTNSTMLRPCIKYALLKSTYTSENQIDLYCWLFLPFCRTASARHLFAVLSGTVSFSCWIFSDKGPLKPLNSWSSKQPVWGAFLPVFEVAALIKLTSAVCGFVFFPYLSFLFKTRQKMTLLAGCSQAPSSLGEGFLFLLSSRDERL